RMGRKLRTERRSRWFEHLAKPGVRFVGKVLLRSQDSLGDQQQEQCYRNSRWRLPTSHRVLRGLGPFVSALMAGGSQRKRELQFHCFPTRRKLPGKSRDQ